MVLLSRNLVFTMSIFTVNDVCISSTVMFFVDMSSVDDFVSVETAVCGEGVPSDTAVCYFLLLSARVSSVEGLSSVYML